MKHYDEWGGPTPIRTITRDGPWPGTRRSSIANRSSTMAHRRRADYHVAKGHSRARAQIRNHTGYVIDLMPTALDVLAPKFMEEVDGVKQMPLMVSASPIPLTRRRALARTEQYYEQFGNRAMYKDGWKAVTIHGNRMPWVTAGAFL